jgi:hypothetical protein
LDEIDKSGRDTRRLRSRDPMKQFSGRGVSTPKVFFETLSHHSLKHSLCQECIENGTISKKKISKTKTHDEDPSPPNDYLD